MKRLLVLSAVAAVCVVEIVRRGFAYPLVTTAAAVLQGPVLRYVRQEPTAETESD